MTYLPKNDPIQIPTTFAAEATIFECRSNIVWTSKGDVVFFKCQKRAAFCDCIVGAADSGSQKVVGL